MRPLTGKDLARLLEGTPWHPYADALYKDVCETVRAVTKHGSCWFDILPPVSQTLTVAVMYDPPACEFLNPGGGTLLSVCARYVGDYKEVEHLVATLALFMDAAFFKSTGGRYVCFENGDGTKQVAGYFDPINWKEVYAVRTEEQP